MTRLDFMTAFVMFIKCIITVAERLLRGCYVKYLVTGVGSFYPKGIFCEKTAVNCNSDFSLTE